MQDAEAAIAAGDAAALRVALSKMGADGARSVADTEESVRRALDSLLVRATAAETASASASASASAPAGSIFGVLLRRGAAPAEGLAAAIRSGPPATEQMLLAMDDSFERDSLRAFFASVDRVGNTFLHIVASMPSFGVACTRMVLLGADPSMRNSNGETPMHVAAASGRLDCLQALCMNATPPMLASHGQMASVLVVALKNDPTGECAGALLRVAPQLLSEPHGSFLPIHFAARVGNLAGLRALVAAGADVDTTAADGRTPLFLACEFDQIQCVAELLALGADPDVPADGGVFPVHAAAALDQPDCAGMLRAEGVRFARVDGSGRTPAHISMMFRETRKNTGQIVRWITEDAGSKEAAAPFLRGLEKVHPRQ